MIRRLAPVTVFAAALSATTHGSDPAQDREATMHVIVTHRDSTQPVTGLTVDHVTVRAAGEIVPEVRLDPVGPLSVVLLIDVTRSMSDAMASFVWDGKSSDFEMGPGRNPSGLKPPDSPSELFLAPIVRHFVPSLGLHDRVRMGRIAHVPNLIGELTADHGALIGAARRALSVSDTDRYGRTPIWDAVDMAVSALEPETGRRAIVLVTDGLATGNTRSLDAVIRRASHADVAVFVVAEATGRLRSARGWSMRDSTTAPWFRMSGAFGTRPELNLEKLARSTGGLFIPDGFEGSPDPGRRLRTAIALLHGSYALTFRLPRPLGETDALTLAVDPPDVEVHVKDRVRVESN